MNNNYKDYTKIFKALCDSNRFRIVELLSNGELCACEILKNFEFTQPTLSHHMKVLIDCELVTARKQGQWNHYSLNKSACDKLVMFSTKLASNAENCICSNNKSNSCKES